ncbi:MAG: ATP-binding protein [Spongiibacter marinus]|uniref:ATP-binding response regulator n=1 Tax=Spongiibacter marinus TaxID=354246 RepID=UPI003C64EF1B
MKAPANDYLPDLSLESQITRERHNLFMAEVGSRIVVSAAIALALLLPFNGAMSRADALLWTTLVLTTSAVSLLVVSFYKRHRDSESGKIKKWHAINIGMALMWSGLWCVAPYLFFHGASTDKILVFLLVITLISSTPSVSMGVYPDIFISFITPLFISLSLYLIRFHAEQSWFIKGIPLLTLCSLTAFSLFIHKAQLNNIRLRIEADIARRDAERANRSKNQFMAAVSHDLRQPLQAASLYASLIHEQGDAPSRELSEKILTAIASGGELLEQLLLLSRLQSRHFSAKPQPFSLDEHLAKLINECLPQALQKGLALHNDVQRQHWLNTDPLLFDQLLRNLLGNAVKYTERGTVRLSSHHTEKQLELTVSDTGIGIDPMRHDSIFKEFTQLASRSNDAEDGLGLGLSIVRRVCELCGLTLRVDSTPGQGSRFTVALPLAEKPSAVPASEGAPLPLGRQLRIIVVDDDPRITDALSMALVEWGADVYAFNSLAEALADLPGADEMSPDVMISDGQLANGDTANDVFAALTSRWPQPVPKIVLSGNSRGQHEQTFNADALLLKPVALPELLRRIASLCAPDTLTRA